VRDKFSSSSQNDFFFEVEYLTLEMQKDFNIVTPSLQKIRKDFEESFPKFSSNLFSIFLRRVLGEKIVSFLKNFGLIENC